MNTGFHKSNNLSIDPIPEQVELVAKKVLDSAFKVHTAFGPGLLESVYEAYLAHELKQLGLMFEAQILLPIVYDGMKVDTGLRLDLIVEKSVIIEIKAVDIVQAIHKAQLLTYLKLSGVRLGILINFNVIHLRDGITRIVK
jgi:GxxExxY protein